jgi:Na+/proline symporter
MYSGYTVVCIPNEAYRTGWIALRWMPSFVGVVWGLIGTSFRLHKVSQYRNHQSPADFITDRFPSQLLRYTIVLLQIITSVIY